jgi:hypothetical protein
MAIITRILPSILPLAEVALLAAAVALLAPELAADAVLEA